MSFLHIESRLHILFVDDDIDDREIITETFTRLNWKQHIQILHDGDALFAKLQSLKDDVFPSLIVLDAQLPKQGGESILRKLKKSELFQNIPVMMLTSSLQESQARQFKRLGASACWQKPYTFNEFDALMREMINFVMLQQSRVAIMKHPPFIFNNLMARP